MTPLNIAIVGTGIIGLTHLKLVNANPRTQLCALVDANPAQSALAQQHNVPFYSNIEALFAIQKPDGVILATPNKYHISGAMECVKHGVPALIEKPLADTLEEVDALLAAQAKNNTPLLVGHHRRHSAALSHAKKYIEEGKLGNLVAANVMTCFYKPDHYFAAGEWRTQLGGGPVMINFVHDIDSLRFLCGEVVEIQAMRTNNTRKYVVEDTAAVLLRFENGMLATFLLSDTAAAPYSWEMTSGENKAYPTFKTHSNMLFMGTKGTLSVPNNTFWHYEDIPDWWQPIQKKSNKVKVNDPMEAQLAHFCDVIIGKKPPLVTVADAARSVEVTLEVLKVALIA